MFSPLLETSPFIAGLVDAITNGQPENFLLVSALLAITGYIIYLLGGRVWAFLYFVSIPFLNWSFGVVESICFLPPTDGEPIRVIFDACMYNASDAIPHGLKLHPLVLVTGLVFVLRDFVQRRVGQRVTIIMALGICWAFYYAWPAVAIASGIAFAVSEFADWALYTFSKYRLSTRILLSSAIAVPIDTTIFLYGLDIAAQQIFNDPAGSQLHAANWIVSAMGKMVAALIISRAVRRQEDLGRMDPLAV